MNPESITIKGIDHTQLVAMVNAINWVIQDSAEYYETTDSHETKVVYEAMKQLRVKLTRKMMSESVKSIKLNRMEYRTILLVHDDLFDYDLDQGIRMIVAQIDPKV